MWQEKDHEYRNFKFSKTQVWCELFDKGFYYPLLYISVCACVRACVRACMRACVCVVQVLPILWGPKFVFVVMLWGLLLLMEASTHNINH